MATLVCTFEDILAGAAGPQEAQAAQRWLDAGAPTDRLPTDLLVQDEHGTDMRVAGAMAGKRRRITAAAPLSPLAAMPASIPAEAQRPALSSQRQPQRPASNNYGWGAFLSHGDAIGLAARRRGRGAVPAEFRLPDGWRASPQAAGNGGKPAAGKPAAGKQKRQEKQERYLSPEGLEFPSLQAVQAAVDGPVLVPRKLLRWLRQVAADPLSAAAREAPTSDAGRAHLLGLQRMRVALVPEDQRQWKKRLAAAAAEKQSAERLRRRS